jgi:hypothetical protein
MKEIFVNRIIEENNITRGLCVLDNTTHKNLEIIYTTKQLDYIKSLLKTPPKEGFHSLDRFCQFVVLTQYDPVLGLSMSVYDFNDNMDNVLDEYLILTEKEWDKSDIEMIAKLFQEGYQDKNNRAKMIIEALVL